MRKLIKLTAFLLAAVVIIGMIKLPDIARRFIYPTDYSEYISEYSAQFDVDRNFIYAVVKTESNFDPNATSDVGARGLMQLMPDAYDWVKFRMDDMRVTTFDNMYDPELNVEYGTYMLSLFLEEYGGNYETALAAYHSGRGNVNKWLKDPEYSSDGTSLEKIPSAATAHYVDKVMRAYKSYTILYSESE